jgi:hypothetical protein
VPLNRTTVRALAASVAMFTAGGTVAAAAVFHLPVLGFDAAGASASPRHLEQAAVIHARAHAVTPVRVVKTRVVTEIVHHHAVAASTSAHAAPVAVAAPAPASVIPTGNTVPMTSPPVAQPPTGPTHGDDGHEADDTHETGHDGHGGADDSSPGTGQSTGGTQVGQ